MHTFANTREKRRDFWIAFAAWLGINVAAVILIQAVSSASGNDNSGSVLGALSVLLLLLNLAAVVVLALNRRYAALGAVVAVGASLLVAVLEAVFFVISIFAGGYDATYLRSDVTRGSIEVTYAFLIAGLIVGAVGVTLVLKLVHKQIR
jgi:uncharacterized membrane protein YhaH (DUF805 family)